jgi:hypothetical protein
VQHKPQAFGITCRALGVTKRTCNRGTSVSSSLRVLVEAGSNSSALSAVTIALQQERIQHRRRRHETIALLYISTQHSTASSNKQAACCEACCDIDFAKDAAGCTLAHQSNSKILSAADK